MSLPACMKFFRRLLLLVLTSLSLALTLGCAHRTSVIPLSAQAALGIDRLYVVRNPKDHMEAFYPALVEQLEAMGYKVVQVTETPPPEARFVMSYVAQWNWDVAMYLRYFRATVKDGPTVVAEVEFLTDHVVAKFGRTEERLKEILPQLLPERPTSSANAQ